jgi:two-component system alkaline phosphatase synthesis response regulator PhoP
MVGATIVVSDDEAHVRHVLARRLSEAGYQVLTAVDGQEALDLCRTEKPALLITDSQMPCLDGLELCRRLRDDRELPAIPVILLTAKEFEFEGADRVEDGIAVVIGKPFSPREVLQEVRQLLSASRPTATRRET